MTVSFYSAIATFGSDVYVHWSVFLLASRSLHPKTLPTSGYKSFLDSKKEMLVDEVCTVQFTTATLPMCSRRIGNVRISTSVPAPAARAEADCCSLSYGCARADATVVPIRVRPRPWFCLVPLRRTRRAGLLRPRRFQLDSVGAVTSLGEPQPGCLGRRRAGLFKLRSLAAAASHGSTWQV